GSASQLRSMSEAYRTTSAPAHATMMRASHMDALSYSRAAGSDRRRDARRDEGARANARVHAADADGLDEEHAGRERARALRRRGTRGRRARGEAASRVDGSVREGRSL